MEEDECGMAFSIVRIRWKKELPVDLQTVSRGEDYLLGRYELLSGICRWNKLWREIREGTLSIEQCWPQRRMNV